MENSILRIRCLSHNAYNKIWNAFIFLVAWFNALSLFWEVLQSTIKAKLMICWFSKYSKTNMSGQCAIWSNVENMSFLYLFILRIICWNKLFSSSCTFILTANQAKSANQPVQWHYTLRLKKLNLHYCHGIKTQQHSRTLWWPETPENTVTDSNFKD